MCKNQLLTRLRSSLAIAALTVGLVVSASLPAAAHTRATMQPGWAGREHVKMHRVLNYTSVQPGSTYVPSVPPDYCDLPSAGCESYLSN
jgi:hypothetical protein